MTIKPGFQLRQIVGENVIVAFGKENIDFCNIISLNESAAYIWNKVIGKDFTEQEVADLLCEEYEVDAETAYKDACALVESWKNAKLI